MATFETRGWDDVDFETRGWDEVEKPAPQEVAEGPELSAEDAQAAASAGDEYWTGGKKAPGVVESFRRGTKQLSQGMSANALSANQRTLDVMNRIDSGESVREIDDPVGYLQMDPEQRKQARAAVEASFAGSVGKVAGAAKELNEIPRNERVDEMARAKTFSDVWEAFKKAPGEIVYNLFAESLPQMAPGLVGAAIAGPAGGAPAAAAAMGFGSYATEYASGIVEALTEAGVDITNQDQLRAAVADRELMERIRQRSATKAGVVGLLDAASGGAAGKVMAPARLAGKPVARELTNIAVQAPVQGALGGGGEALGSMAAGKEVQPGEVGAEFVAEFATTPADILAMALSRGKVRARGGPSSPSPAEPAPPAGPQTFSPDQAPVTFESIAGPILAKKSNDTDEDIDASIRQAEAAIFGETPTSDTAIAEGLIASAIPGVETPQTPYGQPPELPVPPLVPDRGYDTGRGELDPDKVLATELQTPGAPESPQAPVVPPEPGTVAPMAGAASMESRQLAAEEKRQRGELLTGVEREQAAEFRARPAPEIQTSKTVEIGQIPHDLDAPFPQLVAKLRSARKAETVAQIQSVISERYGISPEEIPRRGPLPTELMARAAKIALKEPQAPYQTGPEAAKPPATTTPAPEMAPAAAPQPRQGAIDTTPVSVPQPAAKAAPVVREPAALDEEGVGYLQERRGAEERATSMQVEREARKVDEKGQFAKGERQAVRAFAEEAGVDADEVEAEVRRQKARHPPSAGWAPLVATGLDPEKSIADGVKYQIVPWTFHKSPKGVPKAAHVDRLSSSMLREVKKTIAMARAGNENAKAIVDQMHWYTGFNKNLRSRFGGFGEMFADIIGATSPLQNVTENYKSAKAAAARFLNGDYDVELRKLEKHLAQGKSSNDFPARDKIRTLTGELFGVNSAAAMKAMLGIWQEVKKGTAPKTRNFAKNLLGTSTAATIDSWAARTLQRLAGQPRIPPMAEGGVRGTHLTDPSQVGSSFGFGQEVFEKTAQKLRDAGVDITAADLQAMMWFSEKALWTKNNWTTKAGEGGSLEAEMAKDETDRYQGLVSAQQGEVEPTEGAVRGVIGSLRNILSGDSRVLMHREIPTIGGYMDGTEQALDVEIVADQEWDPMPTFSAMVEEAKKNKQDSVGLSRVIRPGEQNANSRPGVEVYLKKDAAKSDVLAISKALRDTGAGGFTLAVDARARRGDPATPGDKFIGIRVQYVPEVFIRAYHQGWATGEQADKDYADLTSGDEARVKAAMDRAEEKLDKTLDDLRKNPAVAHAEAYHYDTLLVGKEEYDSYGTREAGSADQEAEGSGWPGQSAGERLREAARRHADAIGVDPRSLGGERVGDEAAAESGAGEGNRPPDGPAQGGLNVQEPRDGYEALPQGPEKGRRSAKSPVRRSSGRVPGGYRMRALGIERHLVQAGATALVGKQVKTAADLADLAQVYRNPHYETFRFFFVDKAGKIVHAGAVSARLPGQTGIFPSELGVNEGYEWIRSQMPPEATGYYILHNHPSGIPTPSVEDVDMTEDINNAIRGFKGHVVINHNKYATINGNRGVDVIDRNLGAKDFFVRESGGPIGSTISSPASVAELGFGLRNGNFLTMIGVSQRGVQAIADITVEEINHPMRGPAAIRRFARAAGTSRVFIAGERNLVEKITAASTGLIEDGFLTDVVGYANDGQFWSARERGVTPEKYFGDTRTSVVREQSFPIPEVSPATPVVSLRPQKPNASTAVGINYGKSERAELDGNAYGKGAPGAEMSRIEMEEDPAKRARLMNRVYFYAQTGDSLPKSEGVVYGSHVRRAKLTNLYNFTLDPEGLVKKAAGDRNAAELNIVDAGYDGYLVTTAYPSPAIVLVDAPKKVRVEYMGFRAKAQENLGKVMETGPDYSAGPLWYSKLAKLIAETKTETMPAKQWAAYIDNLKSKGAKQDEIQWSGVKEWLDLQGVKVTKAQILDYLNANGVKVEETTLGDSSLDVAAWWNDEGGANEEVPFEDLTPEQKEEAHTRYILEVAQYEEGATKFASYQLPGGKNYRELLLTLPVKIPTSIPVGASARESSIEPPHGGVAGRYYEILDASGARIGNDLILADNEEDAVRQHSEAQRSRYIDRREGGAFRSSHFDTPNILAHVRFNERWGSADGTSYTPPQKILFIEEIQSDWAQKGKKEGFGEKKSSLTFIRLQSEDSRDPNTGDITKEFVFRDQNGNSYSGWGDTQEEAEESLKRWLADNGQGRVNPAVPAAPFVTKTEAWVGLVLKRMIRYAADNGFDGIAWTNGEQQAARYDLSKHLSRIEVTPMGKNERDFVFLKAYDRSGVDVLQRGPIKPEALEELIGKDAAAKAIEQYNKNGKADLRGLDLKVGGEGMKKFYDEIVPNVAKEVLKGVGGGRVGELAIPITGAIARQGRPANEAIADFLREDENAKQPGFYLTPEMKAKASQGMAMFEPREAYKVAEPNDDYSLDFTGGGMLGMLGQMSGAMRTKVDRKEFEASRGFDRPLKLLKALAQDDETFQFGRSDARKWEDIIKEMGLTDITGVEMTPDGKLAIRTSSMTTDPPLFEPPPKGYNEGDEVPRSAYVTFKQDKLREWQTDDEAVDTIEVNTSGLRPGMAGKQVYQLLFTWAANNGVVFMPDAYGVSSKAAEARVANGIAAAMRLGTTKFMWPTSPKEWNDAKAVPVWLRTLEENWKVVDEVGDKADEHNQRLLIKAQLEIINGKLKKADIVDDELGKVDNLDGIEYNFFTDQIVYRDSNEPVEQATLDQLARALLPPGVEVSGDGGARRGAGVVAERRGSGEPRVPEAGSAPARGARATLVRGIVLQSALNLSPADIAKLSPAFFRAHPAVGTPRQGIVAEREVPYWVKTGSPELQSAASKIDTYVPEKPFAEKLADLRAVWKEALTQKVFDAYAPLKKLGRKEYVLARMAKASGGALEGTLLYGKPKMDDDGAIYGELDKKGFLGFMSELNGEHDRFLMWVAGNRAERLMKEGRENLFKPEEIAAMKELVAGKMKDGTSRPQAYAKAAAALREYNKAVLDVAEKSGLIDGESRKIWEHDFYVPFFRMNEELSLDGPSKVKGLVRQQAFKKLKGGEENLGDLLQNILHNWDHLLAASMANNAARANLKAAEKLGIAVESTETATKDMAKSVGFSKGATFVMDEGTPHWYFVDDPFVLEAVSAINAPQLNWLGVKTMGKFKHWLTLGVTVSPTFRIRNLIRDSLSAVAQNEVSFNLLKNVAQGAQAMDTKGEEYAQNLFSGALIRFGYLTDGKHAEHAKRLIENGVPDKTILDTPTKIKDATAAMWDYWQEVGDRAENVNRAAIARQSRERGQSRLEAAYQARDLLDFSLQGSWVAIRFLTQVVPFLNARLQGLYKLGRSGYDNPARLGAVAGAVAVASVALLIAYKDDDDWKAREDWDRDNYWWFKIGGVAYRIPKPFEVGAIGTIAERSIETVVSDEMNGKRLAERLRSMLMDTFALNPVPQIVKPPIDLYANKDSFSGRQIETRGMENLSKPERASGGTSGVAKVLGKAGNVTGLSPVQIDHLIRGYFGWLGTHVVMGVDQLARPFMDQTKPASKLGDMFVVGDFAKDLPARSSRYLEDFYKDAKKVHETMGDIRKAREAGQMEKVKEILQDRGDDVRLSGLYSSAEQRISETRRRMRIIEASKMEPELKRQRLDELTQQINAIAKVTSRRSTEVRAR